MRTWILKHPICAILRGINPEDAIAYAQAVYDGGVQMFEIAMNSENAPGQIEALRAHFGSHAIIGAGTVLSRSQCDLADAAGAQFFLTPSVCRDTIEYALDHKIPVLPGVMTPTDVTVCLSYGITTMKLFPAGDLPMHYIKSLKGPFDGTEYVAVGGVGMSNLADFKRAGYIGAGIGSALGTDPEEVKKNTAAFVKIWRQA